MNILQKIIKIIKPKKTQIIIDKENYTDIQVDNYLLELLDSRGTT